MCTKILLKRPTKYAKFKCFQIQKHRYRLSQLQKNRKYANQYQQK